MENDQLNCKQYKYNGNFVDEEDLFKEALRDKDLVKKHFIEAKIFDGKSFWEVEKELSWVEDGGEFEIKTLDEIKR